MNHVEKKALWLFSIKNFFYYLLPGFFIYAISAIIGGGLVDLVFDLPEQQLNNVSMLLGLITYLLFCYFMAWLYYQNYQYHLENGLLKFETGIFRKKLTTVPLNKIQDLSIRQGPLARLFSLSTLEVQTAGSGLGPLAEIVIQGLDSQTASELRQQLLEQRK